MRKKGGCDLCIISIAQLLVWIVALDTKKIKGFAFAFYAIYQFQFLPSTAKYLISELVHIESNALHIQVCEGHIELFTPFKDMLLGIRMLILKRNCLHPKDYYLKILIFTAFLSSFKVQNMLAHTQYVFAYSSA